jgi:hypothetical protein
MHCSLLAKDKASSFYTQSRRGHHSNAWRYSTSISGGSRGSQFSYWSATTATRLMRARYRRKRVMRWPVDMGVNSSRLLQRQPRMWNVSSRTSFAYYDRLGYGTVWIQVHQPPFKRRRRQIVLSCRRWCPRSCYS